MANEKLSRQNTESTLRNEKKLVEEKLENFKTEKVGLLKQIEDGKQELSLVRVKKDEQLKLIEDKLIKKDDRLKELEKEMEALRVDKEKVISQKENSLQEASGELERKEHEIKILQSEKFETEEKLLIEKLNSEKSDLEVVASELGINLEALHDLIKNYQRLLFAHKEHDRVVVEDSEGKIAKTKQTLLNSKVSIENVRKVSRECERLAALHYYKILKVSETATLEEIKNTYRKSLEEKEKANDEMKKINEAFEILGDEELRKRYDNGETIASDFDKLKLKILKLEMKALDRSSTLNEIGSAFCFTLPRGEDRSEELKNFKEEMIKAIKETEVTLRIRKENKKRGEVDSELNQARTVAFQEIEKSINEKDLKVEDLRQYANYQERINSSGEVPRENPNYPPWPNPNPGFPVRSNFPKTEPGRLVDEIKRERLTNDRLNKHISFLESKNKKLEEAVQSLKVVAPQTSWIKQFPFIGGKNQQAQVQVPPKK
ncbi:13911_t:CDS:2 [Ambispora leptoticha]|uniref:13911_t:CDS:1 n=1 Tax=Ambispora leptoticha TaxID=144679 RepID=A0A9N9H816_9GLOM|nr:13911_t:CDS:2 [Ambispora leptoticha]